MDGWMDGLMDGWIGERGNKEIEKERKVNSFFVVHYDLFFRRSRICE